MLRRCVLVPGKRYEDWALHDPAGQDLMTERRIRDEIEQRGVALLPHITPRAWVELRPTAKTALEGHAARRRPLPDPPTTRRNEHSGSAEAGARAGAVGDHRAFRYAASGCADIPRRVVGVEWARGDLNPHDLAVTGT